MKIPTTPPKLKHLIQQTEINKLRQILTGHFTPTDTKNRYLHWDKLQHLTPPQGFTSKDYWIGTKLARQALYQELPLFDKYQNPFRLALPDCVLKKLYWIEQNMKGGWRDNILGHPQTKKSYLLNALIEEATSSSQIEGASTTRRIAKEMLRQGRKPKDRSEQMIFNNYHAMQFIQDYKNEPLTPTIIFELHRIITEGTLENPSAAGQFRTPSDDIHVVNVQLSQTLHTPPHAEELPKRLQHFCQFANNEDLPMFIPPILKAIVLHFMLAYDHPFVDGNGRTARAIFYWAIIKQDYWLMEFISISRIIKQALGQYGRSFLYTETDDNDLTYFIIHQLSVLEKAIVQFHHHLEQKRANLENVEQLIEPTKIARQLNYRQLALLEHALKNPGATYTISAHQKTYGISYETARQDLLKMANNLQLLRQRKVGKSMIFVSPSDLEQRL
jgi:Fic family protein